MALRPIIMSGPSGAGKSTLIAKLHAAHPNKFGFSISHTTRSPRPNEQNGREYYFVTRPEFDALVAANGFLETAEFAGNKYGTSFQAIENIQAAQQIALLDIEMEGVKQVKKNSGGHGLDFRYLSVLPPSLEVLEDRLQKRKTEDGEKIKKRLVHAKDEMRYAREGNFDRIIVNEDIDIAFKELTDFIFGAGDKQGS